MDWFNIFKGLIMGLAVAVPVGPVGLMCLQRSTCGGWRLGLTTAIGMCIADTLLAFAAMLSLGIIIEFAQVHESSFSFLTSVVFLAFGVILLIKRFEYPKEIENRAGLAYGFLSAFVLSLSPPTILIILGLLPLLSLSTDNHISYALALAGVCAGSLFWGLLMVFAGKKLRDNLGDRIMHAKTVAGILFITIGLLSPLIALGSAR